MKHLFKTLFPFVIAVVLLAACASPKAVPTTQLQLGADSTVQTIDGTPWELVLETFEKTDLSNGRYAGKTPTTGQHGDWPPHLGVQRFLVAETSDISAQMDIATRILVHNPSDKAQEFRFMWRFNPSEDVEQLKADYLAAASQGDLGFFMSTKTGVMLPAMVVFNNKTAGFGYGCWDCLAHTYGSSDPAPVNLTDPSVGHFGTSTKPTSVSLWPALVIPIPSPDANPGYVLDVTITVPAGTDVVLWFGRYDVPTP